MSSLSKIISAVVLLCCLIAWPSTAGADKLLIYMDNEQNNHLKAYGVAFWCLKQQVPVEWLLNYRGGSFLMNDFEGLKNICVLRGVSYTNVGAADEGAIRQTIEDNNMESVLLEKAPNIAVYTPANKEPWDDAVTLALTYAEIEYKTVWDAEVLDGKLEEYDWIHLHHEDFTGQYGRFYNSFRNTLWYQQEVAANEQMAKALGYRKVSDLKKAVVSAIEDYVARGGMMFAMCSATETFDIALAAENTDIVPKEFDGDGVDADYKSKLDYSKCFAFENFDVSLNPLEYRHSDIDTYPDRQKYIPNAANDYFQLFDFAAKLDPVPTMLVQCHVGAVKGFMGQTTAFRKSMVKKYVTILGEVEGQDEVRYIHANYGKGTFTWLGGHDPEDYQHMVGDPPTELDLYKDSPGYRLILNNVLFPAAKKKERKT
ncbi:MAG: asparagine synthetase B [candidate division Zixibacteria bacterium]|nr:asparagine synthetase B [candidate division Zixibacteria bacterium]